LATAIMLQPVLYANKWSPKNLIFLNFSLPRKRFPLRNSTDDFTAHLHQLNRFGRATGSEDIMNKYPIVCGWHQCVFLVYLSRIPAHRKLKWCRKAACCFLTGTKPTFPERSSSRRKAATLHPDDFVYFFIFQRWNQDFRHSFVAFGQLTRESLNKILLSENPEYHVYNLLTPFFLFFC
jgi:hypothetical protein